MNELTVKYKNELNTIPMRTFNAKEMDLFFSICAKMKNKNDETVRFEFDDLRRLSKYKPTQLSRFADDLEKMYEKILRLDYREHEKGIRKRFYLFTGYEINENEKYVDVTVNPKLDYILNELTQEFTQFELKEFTSLKSSYSKTMYRLLKQFKSTRYYVVTVDEFRDLLDVPKSYRMTHITQKILTPIQKEIEPYFSNLTIKKIKAENGNRIERLEFTFRENDHAEGKLPHVPMHNFVEGYKQ